VRLRSFAFALAVLSCISALPAGAQQTPTAVTRDAQAVSILAQSLSTAGGMSVVAAIQDFTGTGNITYNWAGTPVEAQATVRGMGTQCFRSDSSLPAGTRTWAVSGLSAVLINPDGTRQPSSSYNLANAGSLTLPYVRVASILADTTTSIAYLGTVATATGQSYAIHFSPNLFGSNPTPPGISGVGAFDLFIDSTSYLVVELLETVHSDSTFQQTYIHEVDFSSYQRAGGILAPMAIAEKVGGQQTWSIQLSSISFNSGLTPTTFTP
jgi:hypothetical protein